MNIVILGAGTWGIALSMMLFECGYDITVWSAVSKEIDELNNSRIYKRLDDLRIPCGIKLTKCLEEACEGMDIILFAVPSVYVRSTASSAKGYITDDQIIVNLSKGIESGSLKTMTEVIADEMSLTEDARKRIVALSGPTHAEEVARSLPTTIVAACSDIDTGKKIQNAFSNEFFRVYTNTDVLGVEICGAVKNVIALAAGISEGLGYGDNAKAALITRGMSEISRLGKALGCDERTFYGLAGVGDLIVTATSRHSRNNKAGFLIGSGLSAAEAVEEVGMVVEGINALPAVIALASKYGVEMPISFAADKIINHGADPASSVKELMNRKTTYDV